MRNDNAPLVMADITPQLAASSLFDARAKKDKARLRAYNHILEQILHKIAFSASQPSLPTFVYFTIPPFVLGLPNLDLQDCVVYVVYQLRKQGYEVKYTYPNLLWISWAHHERQYFEQNNPVVQAMIPTMAGPEKRKGASAVTMRQAVQGSPLKATDYTPPTAFIESLERPSPYGQPKSRNQVTFSEAKPTSNVLDDLWRVT
jgi:hypothetical protein